MYKQTVNKIYNFYCLFFESNIYKQYYNVFLIYKAK